MLSVKLSSTMLICKQVNNIYSFKKENWLDIVKVEKIKEDGLNLFPSPSPSVKVQIIGGKVYLR